MVENVEVKFGGNTVGLDGASDQAVSDIRKVQDAHTVASDAIARYQAQVTDAVERATRQQELATSQASAAVQRAAEVAEIAAQRQLAAQAKLAQLRAEASKSQEGGGEPSTALTKAVERAEAAYNRQSDAALRASQAVQVAEERAASIAEQSAARVEAAKAKLEAATQRQADIDTKSAAKASEIIQKEEEKKALAIKKAADEAIKARERAADEAQKSAQKEADSVWAGWLREEQARDAAIAKIKEQEAAVAAAAAKNQGHFDKLGGGVAALGQKLGLTGFQTQQLAYQLNDVVGGLLSGQRPFQVLMQQGPQVTQIFGSIGNTIRAVTSLLSLKVIAILGLVGAFAIVTKAAWDYTKAQDSVKGALAGAGAQAGVTRDEFNSLAEGAAAAGNISVGAARDMGIAFINTGKIGSEMFPKLIGLAKDYQVAMGVDAKGATEGLGKAFSDPVKGAEELTDRLGLLDYKTLQLIRSLGEQGRHLEAQEILFARLDARIAGAAEQTNWLSRAMDGLAVSAKNAWNWLGKILTGGTDVEKMVSLQERRAALLSRPKGMSFLGFNANDAELKQVNSEIEAIEKRNKAVKDAEATAENNRKSNKIGELVTGLDPKPGQIKSIRDRQQALRDLTQDQKALAASGLTLAEVNKAIAAGDKQIESLLKGPAAKKPKVASGKGPASDYQMWQEELQRMKVESGNFFADETTMELQFWQTKLGLTKAGTREWVQIRTQIYNAEKQLAQEAVAEEMAQFDYRIQLAGSNRAEALTIEEEKLARIKELWGEDSRQYREELRRKTRMEQEAAQEQVRIQQEAIRTKSETQMAAVSADTEIARIELQNAQAHTEAMASMRMTTDLAAITSRAERNRQMLQLEREQAQREFEIRAQALRDQLALEDLKPEARAKINTELEQLEEAHQNRMRVFSAQLVAVDQQGARDRLQAQRAIVQPWSEAATQMFTNWASGVQTIGDAWNQFGRFILGKMATWCADILTNWVLSQLGMTTATTAGVAARTTVEAAGAATTTGISATSAIIQIGHKAAVAAAGAYSAIAAIPIVGPVLAPLAAAAALAGVLAIGQRIFSAKGGKDKVANDGDMYELHKDEMVLPAPFATNLRGMLDTWRNLTPGQVGGSSIATAAASAGQSVRNETSSNSNSTFNYNPTLNGSGRPQTLESLLSREGAQMRKWFRNQVRDGKLRTA